MDILMPQLGETVAEGKITTWFKAIGDAIKPGDNLFEIETDKVSMEVPSTSAGVLAEIRVPAGGVAPVGAVVAVISDGRSSNKSEARPSEKPASQKPASEARVSATPVAAASVQPVQTSTMLPTISFEATSAVAAKPGRAVPLEPFREVRSPERNYGPARLASGATISPLARRRAVEAGIDLNRLAASGSGARILVRDVERVIADGQGGGAPVPVARAGGTPADRASAHRVLALYARDSYDEVPLDSMRRTIASRLIEAKQTIPHFYLTSDIMVERLIQVREETNSVAPKAADGSAAFKLSVNDFVIKALAMALQRVPNANAVWADDRILRFRQSDVGVAVAINGGLITPVIRHAETKSVIAISNEMRDLAERARARRLKPDEYQGGASAISNLGMYGVREFAAIINPPHATILAVGAVQRRPIESDKGIAFASQMTVTLSCDHRVVDGALGAELLAAFKELLERPVGLMI
jgi:pyruvate dehydrogenase E2 component (dihydrolipoamide acetyltransferase)